jgi:hypothetical protein
MSEKMHALSWDDEIDEPHFFQNSGHHPVLACFKTMDFSKTIISSEIIQ